MRKSEIAIWERYLKTDDAKRYKFEYDVHVGEGVELREEEERWVRELAKWLTQLRVDVIGWADDHMAIFEVKRRGDVAAVGQLLTYKKLLQMRYRNGRKIRMVLVCEDVHPDVEKVLRFHRVDIVRV